MSRFGTGGSVKSWINMRELDMGAHAWADRDSGCASSCDGPRIGPLGLWLEAMFGTFGPLSGTRMATGNRTIRVVPAKV
jgi:hypothetical protein